MTELDPLKMTIELLGGLALFLYGMQMMTDGLKAAAGQQMNTLPVRVRSEHDRPGGKIGSKWNLAAKISRMAEKWV